MVTHTHKPRTGKLRWKGHPEFEVSMNYLSIASAIQWDFCLKNREKGRTKMEGKRKSRKVKK